MLHSVAVDVFITDSTWRNLRSFSSTSFEVRLVENRDAKKTGVCVCVCVCAANICQLAGVQRACNLRCSSFLCFHVCCRRISTVLCFARGLEGFINSVYEFKQCRVRVFVTGVSGNK
jgi:hypothetical protein